MSLILFSANTAIQHTEQTSEISAAFVAAATALKVFFFLWVFCLLYCSFCCIAEHSRIS